jgi:hypothetical protein
MPEAAPSGTDNTLAQGGFTCSWLKFFVSFIRRFACSWLKLLSFCQPHTISDHRKSSIRCFQLFLSGRELVQRDVVFVRSLRRSTSKFDERKRRRVPIIWLKCQILSRCWYSGRRNHQKVMFLTTSDEVLPRQCPCLRAFDSWRECGIRQTRRRSDNRQRHTKFYPGSRPLDGGSLRPASNLVYDHSCVYREPPKTGGFVSG